MDRISSIADRYAGKLGNLTPEEFEEMLTTAAKCGAAQALVDIGLDDKEAISDIRDLRDLLASLRIVRSSAWKTFLQSVGRLAGWIFIILLIGSLVRSDVGKKLAIDLITH